MLSADEGFWQAFIFPCTLYLIKIGSERQSSATGIMYIMPDPLSCYFIFWGRNNLLSYSLYSQSVCVYSVSLILYESIAEGRTLWPVLQNRNNTYPNPNKSTSVRSQDPRTDISLFMIDLYVRKSVYQPTLWRKYWISSDTTN